MLQNAISLGVTRDGADYSGGPGQPRRAPGEIVFDPEKLSCRKLLASFFQIHDATTMNRQGNDRGTSYRSAIFYTSEDQKRIANDTIAEVDASGLWPGKVVTEVTQAGPFWEAEPEHQDYLERYPDGDTRHFIRPGWKLPSRAAARPASYKVFQVARLNTKSFAVSR